MSVQLKDNRWSVGSADFATRVIIPDLKGFFDKIPLITGVPKPRTLVIEPGTRAIVIDEGILLGEVYPGDYTMESFIERLKFWRNKQSTVFLTRAEEVAIESVARQIPCQEGVCLDVHYLWTIQMNDVIAFMNNLMGAKESVSITELESMLSPIVGQAVRDTIGQTPYDEIDKPGFVQYLSNGIRVSVDAKLKRYGLVFHGLQSVQTKSDGDALTERKGELFLNAKETQLQRAAADVQNDRLQARLDEYKAKIPIRSALRDVISEDNLASIQNLEDFKKAISEVDKQRLLRKEDQESLLEAYQQRKEDRQQLRSHLLATLDLQREQELEELRLDLDHAVRMKSLEKEIELARLSRSGDAEQWRSDLERDKEEAAHRWHQKQEKTRATWMRIREARRQSRDDSWEAIQYEQKMEEIQADLQLARAERQRKIALLDEELNTRLAAERLEAQKRQQEWELELRQQKSASQLDRLQKVQEMNARFAEQQHRMQVELESLKADGSHKREIERIQVISGLSTEAMIATAGTDNAALLADLKKHEATQDAVKAQAAASPDAALNDERLRLYEKLNETERAKADAVAEAFKMAMQSQQGNVAQMIGGLAQAATPVPGAPPRPIHAQPGAAVGPPPMPTVEVWHVSFNGTQSPAMNFDQVQAAIQSGQVVSETMIWKSGMPHWKPAGQMPELAGMFGPPPPPGPPGPPPN